MREASSPRRRRPPAPLPRPAAAAPDRVEHAVVAPVPPVVGRLATALLSRRASAAARGLASGRPPRPLCAVGGPHEVEEGFLAPKHPPLLLQLLDKREEEALLLAVAPAGRLLVVPTRTGAAWSAPLRPLPSHLAPLVARHSRMSTSCPAFPRVRPPPTNSACQQQEQSGSPSLGGGQSLPLLLARRAAASTALRISSASASGTGS